MFKLTKDFQEFSPFLGEANKKRQNYRVKKHGMIRNTCMCCKFAHIGRIPDEPFYAAKDNPNAFCRFGGFRLEGNYRTCDKHKCKDKTKMEVITKRKTSTW